MGNVAAAAAGEGGQEEVEQLAAERTCAASLGVDGVPHRLLAFCSWEQRAGAAALGRDWRRALGLPESPAAVEATDGACHWRFLCERLAAEHNVYVPAALPGCRARPPPGVAPSWRSLFMELYAIRHRLDATQQPVKEVPVNGQQEEEQEQFSIKVAVRFKPAGAAGEEDEEQSIVLPLHQKVQIVRETHRCSKKEALEIIMRDRGQATLGDKFSHAMIDGGEKGEGEQECSPGASSSESLVADPDLEQEMDLGDAGEEDKEAPQPKGRVDARASVLAVQEAEARVLAVAPGVGLRDFSFDRVFGERSRQADTYELCAQRLIVDFLNGQSSSVICYGQTGSGKTYTMFGPHGSSAAAGRGIVPRACQEALESMQERRARGVQVELGLSYVEIFGSEISDLLREGRVVGQGQDGRYTRVRATDRVGHRYVLDGHTECRVESFQEVQDLLASGDRAKRLAATAMNQRSTRAHTVLVLSLCQTLPGGKEINSRLFLADLGGSEKISKSRADEGTVAPVVVVGGVEQSRVRWRQYYSHRQQIQETLHINKGLFALKKVMEALHQRSNLRRQNAQPQTMPYVPYQDSKLTMLLKEALGGDARTLVFCTVAMEPCHAVESLQTLRFGERCSQVQQQGTADKVASVQAALKQLAEEIKLVEGEIVKKERWETRLVKRRDVDTVAGKIGEEFGKVIREEVIPTSVLVGAEREREELERLLQRQLELQGLGGMLTHDYREMLLTEDAEGARGRDFREKDNFRTRMKAKDFEEETVVVEALRFVFRKAAAAEQLGETEESRRCYVPPQSINQGYYRLARCMRLRWEEDSEAGTEHRPFGLATMVQFQEWIAAFRKSQPQMEAALIELLERAAKLPEEEIQMEMAEY